MGDDRDSYAFDGSRIKKWNRESLSYGEAWSAGDIIGTLINFDDKSISFWRNGQSLGRAFNHIKTGANCVYFPAISFQRGQRVVVNPRDLPLRANQHENYQLLKEPFAEVHKPRRVSINIVDFLKSYLINFFEF